MRIKRSLHCGITFVIQGSGFVYFAEVRIKRSLHCEITFGIQGRHESEDGLLDLGQITSSLIEIMRWAKGLAGALGFG